MTIGIYSIVNLKNKKIYIGSSKHVEGRWSQHHSELRGGYHPNKHLQNSWNKYGEELFSFELMEETNIESLLSREQSYIDLFYDGSKKCFNANPTSTIPPIKTDKCALYTLDGAFCCEFLSMRECAEFVGVDESSISRAAKGLNCSVNKMYMVRKIVEEVDYTTSIKKYIPYNEHEIVLFEKTGVEMQRFQMISDVCVHMNGHYDKVECGKIAQSLNFIHSYKGNKIMYLSDFDRLGVYPDEKIKSYKYILKYDVKGELLDVVENKYGLKFIGTKADNCKLNTRILLINRDDYSLRVFNGECVYIKSNVIIDKIKTGIVTYCVFDGAVEHEFLKMKDACLFVGATKSTFQSCLSSKNSFKNKYIFSKKIY
ncbi:MAG: GIY-YIG nuclease family protein [Cetobacterium sp.]